MSSLNDLLKKFCLAGKARFYFSEFVNEANISDNQAEKYLIPLMGKGKIRGELELRCPRCGKDLGIFKRLPEIPENNVCPICDHNFSRSFNYIEIILEVEKNFFPVPAQVTLNPQPQRLSTNALIKLMKDALREPEIPKKGKKFEEAIESLMYREDDFEYIDKHSRSEIGEVDYVYYCNVRDNILWENSPIVCIECKNWKEPIGSKDMNQFISIVREKGPFCSCGVYITSSSFSDNAETSMRDARIRDKITIVPIEGKELNDLINYGFKTFVPKICLEKLLHH